MALFVVILTLVLLFDGGKGGTICASKKCFSEDYTMTICSLSEISKWQVVNVTVTSKQSESECTFYNGTYEEYNGTGGVYGYDSNAIWVDKGCKAHFWYCKKGENGDTICGDKKCFSEGYNLMTCNINQVSEWKIFNATVSHKESDSNCTLFDESYEEYNGSDGVYGYCSHAIWVDLGCRAYFYYCMTDEAFTETRICSSSSSSPRASMNLTTMSPSEATSAWTNDTDYGENTTTPSANSSTSYTVSTISAVSPQTAALGCVTDGNDVEWKIPVYAGAIIIAVVVGIFLLCGIILIYLLLKRQQRLMDDTLENNLQHCRRPNTESISGNNRYQNVQEKPNIPATENEDGHYDYISPVSRSNSNKKAAISADGLDGNAKEKIGFVNPSFQTKSTDGANKMPHKMPASRDTEVHEGLSTIL